MLPSCRRRAEAAASSYRCRMQTEGARAGADVVELIMSDGWLLTMRPLAKRLPGVVMDKKQEESIVKPFSFPCFPAPIDRDKYSRRTCRCLVLSWSMPIPSYCPRVHECDTVAVYVFRIQENTRIQNTRIRLSNTTHRSAVRVGYFENTHKPNSSGSRS